MTSLVASLSKKLPGITAIPQHMGRTSLEMLWTPTRRLGALSADQLAHGLCPLVPQQASLEGFLAC